MKNSTPTADPAKAPDPYRRDDPPIPPDGLAPTGEGKWVAVYLDDDDAEEVGLIFAHGQADIAGELAVLHCRTMPIDAALEDVDAAAEEVGQENCGGLDTRTTLFEQGVNLGARLGYALGKTQPAALDGKNDQWLAATVAELARSGCSLEEHAATEVWMLRKHASYLRRAAQTAA